jgi:hypothetical protein
MNHIIKIIRTKLAAYETKKWLKEIQLLVLTKFNAYGTKRGFYGPKKRSQILNHLSMQTLKIIKSEFPPGLVLWQNKKQFFNPLKFTTMKKQILLLLALTVFAGINHLQAQCTGTAITPAPGIEYDYTTIISGPGYDGNGFYDYYVTQNTDVLTGIIALPSTFFTVDAATPYHNPANTVNHILITWEPAATGQVFYLVLRYREENSTASPICSAENIRVWEIKPLNTFLLALVPGFDGFTCAADADGAVVTAGIPPNPSTLLLSYGENTLYYLARASGILGDWKPWVRIPALQATQTYVSVEWSADTTGAGVWTAFSGLVQNGATQDLESPTDATVTNATAGTSILIKVVIDNHNWQTLADQVVTLALDGYLPIAYTESDIIGGTGPNACDPAAPFLRTADFTVKARPTLTGNPPFIGVTNP